MSNVPQIHRHKTAIGRAGLSKPFRAALESHLIHFETTVFDYGCGRGDDLRNLADSGFQAAGWDPVHQPQAPRISADVVNLGYVVNVIENVEERANVVRSAWDLAKKLLIVSARLVYEAKEARFESYADGCLTGRGTFQKFFNQLELRDWLEQVLVQRALAAAPGIFFIFRDEELRQRFLEARYRRHRAVPVPRMSDILFQQHENLLMPLMEFVADRGRLPAPEEFPVHGQLAEIFGSVPKAFAVVRRVTGAERWEQLQQERREELLIHFALDRFGGRPRFSELPADQQLDVREFFSTYNKACVEGDKLLFRTGNMAELNHSMEHSPVGKLTGEALYVHVDALAHLPALLRVYEGCARSYLGHVEGANLIKLNRVEPKVSYLLYPEFNTDPHPALAESLRLKLSNGDVKHLNFRDSTNPPILHRKETFLGPDDPRRERFEHLTKQEERHRLFDDTATIGTRNGWEKVLLQRGVTLKGHRLVVRR
ncbi:MAG TPA: DNA phosphorothioation-associated putative methyltransferase [Phycisphaerae bacterium]|nr:DNA phosphorothioation-associated putative methyltransferase [Phycisphaerae bacterium]